VAEKSKRGFFEELALEVARGGPPPAAPRRPRRPASPADPPPPPPDAAGERPGLILGVDPGFSGGLAALSLDGRVVATRRMPITKAAKQELDELAIIRFVRGLMAEHEIRLVVIEKVGAMPSFKGPDRTPVKQGASSAFSFGYGAGGLRGLIRGQLQGGNLLPLEMPMPQTWMKRVLVGVKKGRDKKETKQNTIAFCKRRWPGADLVGSSSKAAKDCDGIADALALAEYGRQLIVGSRH
jgi:hypothetical protein